MSYRLESIRTASQSLREAYAEFGRDPSRHALLATLSEGEIIPVSMAGNAAGLIARLRADEPAFAIVRHSNRKLTASPQWHPHASSPVNTSSDSFIVVTYVAEEASKHVKSLFAIARITLARELDPVNLSHAVLTCNPFDLCESAWDAHFQRSRHDPHHLCAETIRNSERAIYHFLNASSLTNRLIALPSNLAAPNARPATTPTTNNAEMRMGNGVLNGLRKLVETLPNFLQLYADPKTNCLQVVSLPAFFSHTPVTLHHLASLISSSEPRYIFYRPCSVSGSPALQSKRPPSHLSKLTTRSHQTFSFCQTPTTAYKFPSPSPSAHLSFFGTSAMRSTGSSTPKLSPPVSPSSCGSPHASPFSNPLDLRRQPSQAFPTPNSTRLTNDSSNRLSSFRAEDFLASSPSNAVSPTSTRSLSAGLSTSSVPVIFVYSCPLASSSLFYSRARKSLLLFARSVAGLNIVRKLEISHPSDLSPDLFDLSSTPPSADSPHPSPSLPC